MGYEAASCLDGAQKEVRRRREKKRHIDLDAELEIQQIQRKFKLAAVVIPPIPPLLVGLIVLKLKESNHGKIQRKKRTK